jgi:hypothetical protein
MVGRADFSWDQRSAHIFIPTSHQFGLTILQDIFLFIDQWLPKTLDQVYLIEIGSMMGFGVIATCLALNRMGRGKRFDIFFVLRSIGSGAAFPPAVLLIFYPVSPGVRALFSLEALKIILSIGGATAVMMSLYALFKKP